MEGPRRPPEKPPFSSERTVRRRSLHQAHPHPQPSKMDDPDLPPLPALRRPSAEFAAVLVKALMLSPSTKTEVGLKIGISPRNAKNIKFYLEAFHDAGLTYILEWRNAASPVWAWQPEPYLHPDADRPPNKPRPSRSRLAATGLNSVDIRRFPAV